MTKTDALCRQCDIRSARLRSSKIVCRSIGSGRCERNQSSRRDHQKVSLSLCTLTVSLTSWRQLRASRWRRKQTRGNLVGSDRRLGRKPRRQSGQSRRSLVTDRHTDALRVRQIAHVIFTTSNSTSAKAFPSSKPFNSISLNDADSEQAYRFLSSQLLLASPPVVLPETAKSTVSKLGGRRTDLELLLIKLRAGAEVEDAVSEIVKKNCAELRKQFLDTEVDDYSSDTTEGGKKRKSWSRLQAWTLIKGLAQHSGELNYADSLVNVFSSNEKALKEIEAAELISIHHSNGRPSIIRPAKPVYQTAFESLLSDRVYASTMEYALNQAAISKSEKELADASAELVQLSTVVGWKLGGGTPTEVQQSAQRLLAKMGSAEEKLAKLEKEKARLLEIFKKEK